MPRHTPVPARVRRLSAGVLAAALLIPVTATAPAQAVTLSASQEQTAVTATADTKAPALSSVTRTTPEKVGPGESVQLQWSSDATDIRYVYASFINETGQTISDLAYPGEDLEMTLDPQTTAEGTYRLDSISITDVTGIGTYYYGDGRVYTSPSAATPAPAVNLNLDALTFTVQVASPEVTPAAVVFTDEDGTAVDTYTIPDTDGVEYLLNGEVVAAGTYPGAGTVEITARAQTGYVLAAGVTTSWTTSFKAAPQPVTPAAVTFTDEDGTAADTYTIPDTEGVDYVVNGTVTAPGTYPGTGTVTVTARAKTDYVLADGAGTSWSNTFASTMAVTPAAPVFTDKPSTYTVPATTGVQYYVNGAATASGTYKAKGTGTVEITARAQDGYVLTEDAPTSWKKTFKKSPTHVTPGTVVFTDEKGTAADTYTIPDTEGVDYLVNGTVTAPGTYPGTDTVKVKTKAQTGYVVNGPGTWKTTFKR